MTVSSYDANSTLLHYYATDQPVKRKGKPQQEVTPDGRVGYNYSIIISS